MSIYINNNNWITGPIRKIYLFVRLLLNILLDCSCSYNCFISASPGRKTKTAPVHSHIQKNSQSKIFFFYLDKEAVIIVSWHVVQGFIVLFTRWVAVISINNPLQQTLHQVHVDFVKIHSSQRFHYRLWVILTKEAQGYFTHWGSVCYIRLHRELI